MKIELNKYMMQMKFNILAQIYEELYSWVG